MFDGFQDFGLELSLACSMFLPWCNVVEGGVPTSSFSGSLIKPIGFEVKLFDVDMLG